MASKFPTRAVLTELLYKAIETEQGRISVYETAITCAMNDDLKKEWKTCLEQTRRRAQIVLGIIEAVGLDPDARAPNRDRVRGVGEALVQSMKLAKSTGTPENAEIVAWEAVVMAEPADHTNWDAHTHFRQSASRVQRPHSGAASEGFDGDGDGDTRPGQAQGWGDEPWIEAIASLVVPSPPRKLKPGGIASAEHR